MSFSIFNDMYDNSLSLEEINEIEKQIENIDENSVSEKDIKDKVKDLEVHIESLKDLDNVYQTFKKDNNVNKTLAKVASVTVESILNKTNIDIINTFPAVESFDSIHTKQLASNISLEFFKDLATAIINKIISILSWIKDKFMGLFQSNVNETINNNKTNKNNIDKAEKLKEKIEELKTQLTPEERLIKLEIDSNSFLEAIGNGSYIIRFAELQTYLQEIEKQLNFNKELFEAFMDFIVNNQDMNGLFSVNEKIKTLQGPVPKDILRNNIPGMSELETLNGIVIKNTISNPDKVRSLEITKDSILDPEQENNRCLKQITGIKILWLKTQKYPYVFLPYTEIRNENSNKKIRITIDIDEIIRLQKDYIEKISAEHLRFTTGISKSLIELRKLMKGYIDECELLKKRFVDDPDHVSNLDYLKDVINSVMRILNSGLAKEDKLLVSSLAFINNFNKTLLEKQDSFISDLKFKAHKALQE